MDYFKFLTVIANRLLLDHVVTVSGYELIRLKCNSKDII